MVDQPIRPQGVVVRFRLFPWPSHYTTTAHQDSPVTAPRPLLTTTSRLSARPSVRASAQAAPRMSASRAIRVAPPPASGLASASVLAPPSLPAGSRVGTLRSKRGPPRGTRPDTAGTGLKLHRIVIAPCLLSPACPSLPSLSTSETRARIRHSMRATAPLSCGAAVRRHPGAARPWSGSPYRVASRAP